VYRPRPLTEEVTALSARTPVLARIVLGLWFAAGAIYFIASPELDVVPMALALPLVAPFLLGVVALMIFNVWRAIFWVADLIQGK
jgi:hypothetical protein